MEQSTARKLAAESIGTAFLLATVVGSGIMAEGLAGGNTAIALLGNSLSTGAILVVLITVFGPVSGAHFNPAVTVAFVVRREMGLPLAVSFIIAQVAGALIGTWTAHLMFAEEVVQVSSTLRTGPAQWFAEVVATFGLLMAIFGALRWRPDFVPMAVGLYITAAYWFTASTSFANPAVTVARSFTDTFSGIAPAHMPAFVIAQFVGALLATWVFAWLFKKPPD
jgi:glycerol uptake facilitator-like aquaporin